jgi:hypothetical protein
MDFIYPNYILADLRYIRENFGPYFKHKTLTNGNRDLSYPVSRHKDHIHISIRK